MENQKNKKNKIEWVLSQFKSMGATCDDIEKERIKLMTNQAYYQKWCEDTTWIGTSQEPQFYIETMLNKKMKYIIQTIQSLLQSTIMVLISDVSYLMYIMLSEVSKSQCLTEYHKSAIITYGYFLMLISVSAGLKKTKEVIYSIYLNNK